MQYRVVPCPSETTDRIWWIVEGSSWIWTWARIGRFYDDELTARQLMADLIRTKGGSEWKP